MLSNLTIRNFAIIRSLDLEFGPGLNVLTGETGAGKSIILNALNAILGGRCGAELVRSGSEKATVDAVFDTSHSPTVVNICEDLGYPLEDGSLIVTREINAAGKSTVRIGGRPATVAQLREIGEWLVDLHGQHEHQSLLSVPRHLDMLDDWSGRSVLELRQSVRKLWRECRDLETRLKEIAVGSAERERMLDLYGFQLDEITSAELKPGEEEQLLADSRRLANSQRLVEAAEIALAALGGEEGASGGLAAAARKLQDAATIDPSLGEISDRVISAVVELDEAARDLARYRDGIEQDEAALDQIETRLERIRTLKRKYGEDIPAILAYADEIAIKVDLAQNGEERSSELAAALSQAQSKLTEVCAKLSATRRASATDFASKTMHELNDLAMERARFDVQIDSCEPTERGADSVEFLIAPNPGEPLRPLARIASGGEVSRVMLAIKSAMAGKEALPTMVFDEIDVGVGGRTATTIADKLAALSNRAQIICITHLAQIAGRSNKHFYIEKSVEMDRTETKVRQLSEEDRVTEIARMLGGSSITHAVLQHAQELLQHSGKS
ncbi:MAG: DNA repair protein RecN [Chthonomonadales bacterium]